MIASRHIILTLVAVWLLSPIQSQEDITRDSLTPDSGEFPAEKFSDSGLESEILYGALDSQIYEHKGQLMHLYGQAFVKYQDKELKADYIILNMARNFADAQIVPGYPGSIKPTFIDAGKEYKYNRLKYDFKAEKGLVYDAVVSEGEFIIHGERTKYVSEKSNPFSDDDAAYNANALITTCDEDLPHFGFRAAKLKVIPEKVAVLGTSNLELSGIPTPFILPFGFYPLTEGKSSGFIFPSDYEFNSANKGFGLRGFGWYFPFNDYIHSRITADVYSRGSFVLYSTTDYRKRYKYSGQLSLFYDRTLTEDIESAETLVDQGYTIRLDHRQEPKAHPYLKLGGSINIVSNNSQQRVFNDAASVLTNTYRSSFNFSHSLPGTPFSMSAGLNHNQNTQTGIVNISFPDARLNMNTIYPFERRNKGGNEDLWYERISFDYDMQLKSFVSTTDSTLFTPEMYDNIKTGMNHSVSTGFSTRVLKHFNLVPSAQYEETWVLNTQDVRNEVKIDEQDNILKDSIITENQFGFDSYREYSAGVSLNTQIFGTARFSKGWLRGIRHTMKPDIGFSYAPDTRSRYEDSLFLVNDRILEYSRFDNGPFGSPSFNDLQSQLTFSINNNVEIKYFSKKDSTEKKFKIFDNLSVRGNYNFAADSLKWSRVSMNSTSRLFNGITTFESSFTFDPYLKENGVVVDKTVWSKNRKLLRLERAQFRLSTRLTFKQIKEFFTSRDIAQTEREEDEEGQIGDYQRLPSGSGEDRFRASGPGTEKEPREEYLLDLFDNFRIEHNLVYNIMSNDRGHPGELTTHAIAFSGAIPLTSNWNINIGNISYDFVRKGMGYPEFGFSRKLHCWNMRFSWFPNRDTYSFFIGVSSSNLNFIRYNYGQNNLDGAFTRF